mgnify:FL=1
MFNVLAQNCTVTILILIDGFLQYKVEKSNNGGAYGHNPYFNRWFSAIGIFHIDILTGKTSQSLF